MYQVPTIYQALCSTENPVKEAQCTPKEMRGKKQKNIIHVEKYKLFRIALEWSKYGRVAEKEAGKVSWCPTTKRT